jgi:hypothetical protein
VRSGRNGDMHKKGGAKRLFRIWLVIDDFGMFYYTLGRRCTPLKANVAPLFRCILSLGSMLCCGALWMLLREDGRTLRSLAYIHTLGEHVDLTSARFTLQSSKFVSLKLPSVSIFSVRPNLVLVKPPSSLSALFKLSSLSPARRLSLLCVTLVN